jgi:hypothetical protein
MIASRRKTDRRPVIAGLTVIFSLSVSLAAGLHAVSREQGADQVAPSDKHEKKAAARRKPVVPDYSKFELEDPAKLKSEPMQVGATRGGPATRPIPRAPRLGKVYSLQPQFGWIYSGPGRVFLLIVYREDLTELYRMGAATNPFTYPPEAPVLKPGQKYFWSVEVLGAGPSGSPPELAGFVVASEEERAEIEKALAKISARNPYEQARARARLFADRAVWYDAVAAYSDLIAQHPTRAELFEQRGQIFAQLKVTEPLAEEDLTRAGELRRQKKPGNR